jgi:membrane protein
LLARFTTLKEQGFEWLMTPPNSDQTSYERVLHRFVRVLFALIRDLMKGQVNLHAMSLVFTSILSIVPFLALSFSMLRYFNVQNHFLPVIENFLEPMGEKGMEIHQNILSFVDNVKVGVLGAVGLVLLIYTVISLVQKIEISFNSIWHVANTRSVTRRFSNYLTIIFVGPVVIVAAISLASGVLDSEAVLEVRKHAPLGLLFAFLTDLAPTIIVISAFSFFYILIPNTKVRFKGAFIGGAIAGLVWQLAGAAFAAFVVSSSRYDVIYSGFAVGIVGLLWLYTSWLILLLGSTIAFYIQNDNYITRDIELKGSPKTLEKIAMTVMWRIAVSQEQEHAPITQAKLESTSGVPGILVRRVANLLLAKNLIIEGGDDAQFYVLARSSDLISVSEILMIAREAEGYSRHLSIEPFLCDFSDKVDAYIKAEFANVTLRDLLKHG